MISVVCQQCSRAHEFFDGLAGMTVQCKGCRAAIQVGQGGGMPSDKLVKTDVAAGPPKPAQASQSPVGVPLAPPPGIEPWLLESWMNTWVGMKLPIEDMERRLVERGCSLLFAQFYVHAFLEERKPGSARWRNARTPEGSAEIAGVNGLTDAMIEEELAKGARFVVYSYCVSVILFSTIQPSTIQFIRSNESRVVAGMRYTLLSLLLGWWGPWGPLLTLWCVVSNSIGGNDVTKDIVSGVDVREVTASNW